MKNKWWIGLALAALLGVAALGIAQVARADELPPTPQAGYGGYGHGHGHAGGMGMSATGGGLLEPYMEQAMAEAFGLSEEELDALHEQGQSLWLYAQAQGLTPEEIEAKMEAARETAIQAALADGVITQEQADWMLSHEMGMGGPMHGGSAAPGERMGFEHGHGFGGHAGQCPWGTSQP